MMLERRHGTEPKLIFFAVFIIMGSVPALLGWLVWEGRGRRKWKQTDVGYSVGMGQEKRCMMLGGGMQMRRIHLQRHNEVDITILNTGTELDEVKISNCEII